MDLSPLASRDFRVLFGSGTVTLLGTEATNVALVVQVKQLTGSALAVGLLGAAELVPLVVFALYRGSWPTGLDRRRVIRWCEAAGRRGTAQLRGWAVRGPAPRGRVASVTTTRFALVSGGALCVGAVGLVCLALPAFTRYQTPAPATETTVSNNESESQSL